MDIFYVIKKMSPIHCARGPNRCKTCKEYAKEEKYALLDIAPNDPELMARPMIQIEIDGKKEFRVFDVVKYFDTLEAAKDYAKEKKLSFIMQN